MMSTKFKVVNIVAVKNTGFNIDIKKIAKESTCVFCDVDRNNLEWWKIKTHEMTRPVTFWYNGNMISVGNQTIKEAKQNLKNAENYLKKFERVKE